MNIEDFKGASEIDIYLAYTVRAENREELVKELEDARRAYYAADDTRKDAKIAYDAAFAAYDAAHTALVAYDKEDA